MPRSCAVIGAVRACWLAVVLAACAPAARSAGPRSDAGPPLWGALAPGAFAVGFQHMVVRDPARLLRARTADAPGKILRPVFVGLWYPAPRDAAGAMPYARYVDWRIPGDDLAAIARQLDRHGRGILAEEVVGKPSHLLDRAEQQRIERVLATPTAARERAPHIAAAVPLVLYHHGAQGTVDESSILARERFSDLPTPAQTALGITVRAQPATRRPAPHLRDLRDRAVRDGIPAVVRHCAELPTSSSAPCPDAWELDVAAAVLEETRVDLAVDLLDAHLATHPENVDAMLSLARTLERAGNRDRARRAYQHVLQATPRPDKPALELTRTELDAYVRRRDAEAALTRLGAPAIVP